MDWTPEKNPPPAIVLTTTSSTLNANALKVPNPKSVLVITPDGQVMRGDVPIESLTKEQLIGVVDELVALIRNR